jgi:hypothetical protein
MSRTCVLSQGRCQLWQIQVALRSVGVHVAQPLPVQDRRCTPGNARPARSGYSLIRRIRCGNCGDCGSADGTRILLAAVMLNC